LDGFRARSSTQQQQEESREEPSSPSEKGDSLPLTGFQSTIWEKKAAEKVRTKLFLI